MGAVSRWDGMPRFSVKNITWGWIWEIAYLSDYWIDNAKVGVI